MSLAQSATNKRMERRKAEISASKNACDAGKLDECINYGNLYADGKSGLAVDKLRAQEIYIDACNRGSAMGCLNSGQSFNGFGPARDNLQAAKYYKRACDMKNLHSGTIGKLIITVRLGCNELATILKKYPEIAYKLN
jgi:TPR repeat protein